MNDEDIKQAKEAMAVAQLLHKAVPQGTSGNTVVTALAILIGAGVMYAPERHRKDIRDLAVNVIDSIVSGETDIRFEK